MTAKQLKNSILKEAVQGKLIKQNSEDEPASELLKRIKTEREKLIKSNNNVASAHCAQSQSKALKVAEPTINETIQKVDCHADKSVRNDTHPHPTGCEALAEAKTPSAMEGGKRINPPRAKGGWL